MIVLIKDVERVDKYIIGCSQGRVLNLDELTEEKYSKWTSLIKERKVINLVICTNNEDKFVLFRKYADLVII